MATLDIDDGVLEALRGRAAQKGFGSVEEYVRFVLSELARRIGGAGGAPGTGDLSDDEEKAIQDRLRSLGYLE